MKHSDSIGQITTALAAAQGGIVNPERNRTVNVALKSGGSYSFTYATFDEIIAMARPILATNGLAVIQSPSTEWSGTHALVTVETLVAHSSGEWFASEIKAYADNDSPQAIGSVVTYLKRYSYCAMLGIAAEEDDDGNAGSGNRAESAPRGERQPDRPKAPPCPSCNNATATIVGKAEYGGGFVCYKAKGGCGHKWGAEGKPEPEPFSGEDKPVPPPKTKAADTSKFGPFEGLLKKTETDDGLDAVADMIPKKDGWDDFDRGVAWSKWFRRAIQVAGDNRDRLDFLHSAAQRRFHGHSIDQATLDGIDAELNIAFGKCPVT